MLGLARLTGQTFGATIAALVFKLFPHHGQMPVAMGVACALAVAGMTLSLLRLRVGAPTVSPRARLNGPGCAALRWNERKPEHDTLRRQRLRSLNHSGARP